MNGEEWIAAGRPHWQCVKCKGIFVTVPIADDFVCGLCKNPRLRNSGEARAEKGFKRAVRLTKEAK